MDSLSQAGHIPKEDRERITSFAHAMLVFHVETLCHMKDWKQVHDVVEVGPWLHGDGIKELIRPRLQAKVQRV